MPHWCSTLGVSDLGYPEEPALLLPHDEQRRPYGYRHRRLASRLSGQSGLDAVNWTIQYDRCMSGTADDEQKRRLTARGIRTKNRIVSVAADLIRVKGVDATTMDDVRAASGTSKSQIYHHFRDKNDLVMDVIEYVGDRIISRETDSLGRVSTLSGLRRWRDALVHANDLRHGAYGCALGSLAGDVADHDEAARAALARLFRSWATLISEALKRMQETGALKPDVDTDYLADGLLAALQGGYLLAQTAGDSAPMARALDMTLDYIATLSATTR